MIKARDKSHKLILWTVGEGNIDFWNDIWAGEEPLSLLSNPGVRRPSFQVKDFWINRKWVDHKLKSELLPIGVPLEAIEKILEIPIDEEGKDYMRWTLTPHGNFSTCSAWEEVRHHQPKADIFGLIWNTAIPTSFSIFIWRLLANRIPVDTKMQWRNITMASKCRCCTNPKIETREHLFVNGESAKKIWRFFEPWFPSAPIFPEDSTDMEYRVRFWHLHVAGNRKSHISLSLACYILWIIWSERNSVIHNGTTFRTNEVIHRVITQIQWATTARKIEAADWKDCKPSVAFFPPTRRRPEGVERRLIKWVPPRTTWIKLNFSASFKQGMATAGGGGVFRNEEGEIVSGFAECVVAASRLEAELKSMLLGILSAPSTEQAIWVENDNEHLVDLFNKSGRGNAVNRNLFISIKNKLRMRNFKISHTPREGNKLAKHLADQGSKGSRVVFNGEEAPSMVKAMANLEKEGMPNFSQGGDDRPP